MKVYIDVSIFTKSDSVGYSAGHVELETLPRIGESISFGNAQNGALIQPGFPTLAEVEDVIHGIGTGVSVGLKDIVLETKAEGLAFMRYLEEGFGILSNPTECDD